MLLIYSNRFLMCNTLTSKKAHVVLNHFCKVAIWCFHSYQYFAVGVVFCLLWPKVLKRVHRSYHSDTLLWNYMAYSRDSYKRDTFKQCDELMRWYLSAKLTHRSQKKSWYDILTLAFSWDLLLIQFLVVLRNGNQHRFVHIIPEDV